MENIIDISDHQGVIDWEKVKGQTDGVMIRCCWSYGERNDKQFERNISECNRLGIPCGVYLFSYALNEEEAKKEAEWCLELIKPYRIELPVAWDFEYDSVNYCLRHGINVTKEMATKWAKIFLQTVEQAGYWASLYANKDFLTRYFEPNIEKRFDLWYAGWVTPKEATYDSELSYSCGMWQYGTKTYDGINGNVDSNYCYKDYPTIFKQMGLNHLDKLSPEVEWAKEQGITDGTDGDETVTKADLWKAFYTIYNK